MKINRLIIGGGLSTIISYITFPIIHRIIFQEEFFKLSYLIACIINITFSYSIQRIYVYKSKEKLLREYIFFFKCDNINNYYIYKSIYTS